MHEFEIWLKRDDGPIRIKAGMVCVEPGGVVTLGDHQGTRVAAFAADELLYIVRTDLVIKALASTH